MAFENLFKPIKIGPVEIKNRIALAPNGQMYADAGGFVTEQTLAYFAARARGGVGLIVSGCTYATEIGWLTSHMLPSQLSLYDDRHITGWIELVDRVHAFGAKMFIQLSPGLGGHGTSAASGVQPVAPSAIPCQIVSMPKGLKSFIGKVKEVPKEMTAAEIVDAENKMAAAAERAKRAGLDGIEIHAQGTYLLGQFLSPRLNKRTDLYGGSLENRLRFTLNCLTKMREKVGGDMAIGIRWSVEEHIEGGLTLEESKVMLKELERAGLDFVGQSDGTGDNYDYLIPDKDGTMLGDAVELKKVLRIPLIVPSIHDPPMAEQALKDGNIDMLYSFRPLLADPEWPNKVKEGRLNEVRECRRDNHCLLRALTGQWFRCTWNPDSGREKYIPDLWQPLWPTKYS